MKKLCLLPLLLQAFVACSKPQAATLPDSTTDGQSPAVAAPADVEYAKADSIEVVQLLSDTKLSTTIDYARHFLGRPYVAYTLDSYYQERSTSPAGGDSEHLVVNLREFDCLTLLETCNALALSRAQLDAAADKALNPWDVYCCNLERLRYFGGHEDGYLSRIHYLSMSVAEHLERGTMEEVVLPEKITKPRTTNIGFMTKHPEYYYALKNNPELVAPLAEIEHKYSGQAMRFLPQENCGLPRKATKEGAADLSDIQDGDILYIVTTKDGLDYSHQGFAFWGKDASSQSKSQGATSSGPRRVLHMLHASSAKKRVIEDPLTLEAYLKGIPSNVGVRVLRLKR